MVPNNLKYNLKNPNYKVIIQGRNLKLKPININEVENGPYISWLNDKEITKYLEVRHKKQNLQTVVNYINEVRSRKGCELFAIFFKEKHIGTISIAKFDSYNKKSVWGLLIGDKKARTLGFGGEATILLIEFIFSNTIIERIHGMVPVVNKLSWKLIESIGFKNEGTYREHFIFDEKKKSDVKIYGLLKREWDEIKNKFFNILKYFRIQEMNEN